MGYPLHQGGGYWGGVSSRLPVVGFTWAKGLPGMVCRALASDRGFKDWRFFWDGMVRGVMAVPYLPHLLPPIPGVLGLLSHTCPPIPGVV